MKASTLPQAIIPAAVVMAVECERRCFRSCSVTTSALAATDDSDSGAERCSDSSAEFFVVTAIEARCLEVPCKEVSAGQVLSAWKQGRAFWET